MDQYRQPLGEVESGFIETVYSGAAWLVILWIIGALLALLGCFIYSRYHGRRIGLTRLIKIVVLWPLVLLVIVIE